MAHKLQSLDPRNPNCRDSRDGWRSQKNLPIPAPLPLSRHPSLTLMHTQKLRPERGCIWEAGTNLWLRGL